MCDGVYEVSAIYDKAVGGDAYIAPNQMKGFHNYKWILIYQKERKTD